MNDYVVDASAAIHRLLRTPLGLQAERFMRDADTLCAPEIFDAEVMAVFRRSVLRRELDATRAEALLVELRALPIERVSHESLLLMAWEHYQNVSASDALYVALARRRGFTLLTADEHLTRAPNLRATVRLLSSA